MSRRHPEQRSHRDDPASYSLDELSREAGVTPRTVRYYIAEGLLPPPETTGRNASYTQDHLDRLRLIGQLKDQYLPLKEIRARITSLSPEEIRTAVSHAVQADMDEDFVGMAPAPASSAEDYLAGVLHESGARYMTRESRASYARGKARRMPETRPAPAEDRTWKRIPITADAELLITDDAWDRRGDRIRSAITWIRRMLDE